MVVEFVLADAGPALAAKTRAGTRMATKAAMDARFMTILDTIDYLCIKSYWT